MESGIFVLAGAFIGGLFSFLTAQRGSHVAGLEKKLRRIEKVHVTACQQIKAYYRLETFYKAELAKLTSQAEQTVQIKFRTDVENAGFSRPTWTERDAENAIVDLDS